MPYKYDDGTDNDDSDHYEHDPGRDVVEKHMRNRLQRIADHTKDELNKVLKRVDTTLNNYDYSVQASLAQHGMARNDQSNVEHVADLNELESLLNDGLAKQRYKQRLMIFIVGQTELASEKASLLQQVEQFFNEQKQSFSGSEFANYDIKNETQDEVDLTLKSFDVKDCYLHVRELGSKLNELNEDIIQYLIQNAAAKQQLKGKKKFAQATKETKDQLAGLQQKLESVNNEMMNKDNRIETLEKENEKMSHELKTKQEYLKQLQEELVQSKIEIKARNKNIMELEVNIKQYESQINDLQNTILDMQQPKTEDIVDTKETNAQETEDKETQTFAEPDLVSHSSQQILSDDTEDLPDLNLLLNVTEGIDLNNVTTENLPTVFTNLRRFSVRRVTELIREPTNHELENIKQEYEEYKITSEKEQNALIEKANNAYQLQKTAEEALNYLEILMAEQEESKPDLIHRHTQTDEENILYNIAVSPDHSIPIEERSIERLSSDFENEDADDESVENGRRSSVKERYVSFIEERKNQLGHTRRQPEPISPRPISVKEEKIFQPSRHNTDIKLVIRQDEGQQTSAVSSRRPSIYKEKIIIEKHRTDEYKLPFFHLYELIYKFRHSMINLLEQNKFLTLADRLLMIRQLSSDDHYTTNDFLENSDRVLKDTCKVLQACITLLLSSINEYQIKEQEQEQEQEIPRQSSEPTRESSSIDGQQELLLEQKELMIIDLTNKYDHITNVLNQINKKHEEESNQNERLILDQQKLIQNLQQQLIRLQKRLAKIEVEGVVEPSIMFTRLDAERNEQTLQQAVHKGKVVETTYNELNEVMEDYVRLPSQQLTNLVKRYIHFRKATEIEDRIQHEAYDSETRGVLEKMELLYERRSDEISKHMLDIRQQRTHLAQILTEKFDHLEDESSIFLIRPVYSYQGRAAAQSYIKQEKRRRDASQNENATKKNHYPSRQSQFLSRQRDGNSHLPTPLSSLTISDEEERLFHVNNSVASPRSSSTRQPNDSIDGSTYPKQLTIQLSELTRLQQFDIQRTLIPIAHVSAPLLSAFANNSVDPGVPSLNLRSYAALSRPGNSNGRMGKTNEIIHPVSREGLSTLLENSQVIDVRTPFNSSNGEVRRKSQQLPPIKRSLSSLVSATNNEKQHTGFATANEISSTN